MPHSDQTEAQLTRRTAQQHSQHSSTHNLVDGASLNEDHHTRQQRFANQLLFYQALAYTRLYERGRPMSSSAQSVPATHNFSVRPGRFGVIYTTPAHMTAPERVLLYSLILGLQPKRCLEIGILGGVTRASLM